ncbi:flagellar biosynthesis anti-sigma factor FlgM [Erythrobacter sp.]|uniref:flagellar biosynthesis anti-sigma factor FlgM n=1 Tax=Erythrobacter sp. TaxID=1042 RepID=UPI001425D62C|nr:flagellar biosynthesis anti-sigma factor FlgM [Erythrobacter sp.]QIQ87157.1 MAG: flagellar biosynthesis anti-sigma factor FlgM [Erythrobacter sp.]
MPSVELSKLQAGTLQASAAPRAVARDERAPLGVAPSNAPPTKAGPAAPDSGVSIELGAGTVRAPALDTATPPVDRERVAEIRKALEEGRYPLVPTRIADAMIAARVSLGMEK